MNLHYLTKACMTMPYLPALYIQAVRTKAALPDLPPAKDPQGATQMSTQPTFRLLTIGESTVASLGAATHAEGFTGSLAGALSQRLDRPVQWRAYGKSGYSAHKVRTLILPTISETRADMVIIGLGGNDTFELNTPWNWRYEVELLVDELRERFPGIPIAFSNMPPVREFPVFSPLMKRVFGDLVDILGEELRQLCEQQKGLYFHPEPIRVNDWKNRLGVNRPITDFFSDGVHPSPFTYQTWAIDYVRFLWEETDLPKVLSA